MENVERKRRLPAAKWMDSFLVEMSIPFRVLKELWFLQVENDLIVHIHSTNPKQILTKDWVNISSEFKDYQHLPFSDGMH